ncbi:hypothetical protein BsWGS_05587 [Bradybaena similaris]
MSRDVLAGGGMAGRHSLESLRYCIGEGYYCELHWSTLPEGLHCWRNTLPGYTAGVYTAGGFTLPEGLHCWGQLPCYRREIEAMRKLAGKSTTHGRHISGNEG